MRFYPLLDSKKPQQYNDCRGLFFGRMGYRLQLPRDFLLGITFDDVTDLDVVEVLNVQAAVHTSADFLDIVLVTLQ